MKIDLFGDFLPRAEKIRLGILTFEQFRPDESTSKLLELDTSNYLTNNLNQSKHLWIFAYHAVAN